MNAPTLFDQELAEGSGLPTDRDRASAGDPSAASLAPTESGDRETSAAPSRGSASVGAPTFPDPERHPAVRVSDPETCREPSQGRMSAGRWKALSALFTYGPMTDFELADRTGVAQTSIGCRRKDLERAGLVVKTGDKRPSPTGSPALVWALTDAGREFYINEEGKR